jgi:hypothetical protein
VGTRAVSPCSVSCVGVVFGTGALSVVCLEQLVVLATAWVVPGFYENPLATVQ